MHICTFFFLNKGGFFKKSLLTNLHISPPLLPQLTSWNIINISLSNLDSLKDAQGGEIIRSHFTAQIKHRKIRPIMYISGFRLR